MLAGGQRPSVSRRLAGGARRKRSQASSRPGAAAGRLPSATALPSIAAWMASDDVSKTTVRLSSKSSMPAAAIHMRQFGQVTPWRDHSMCTSL